jgi:16S rRNA processing protein RimM
LANDSPVTPCAPMMTASVTGEVRLKVFAEDLSAHRSFNGGALTLKSVRHGNNGAIARFAEISDRTAAEKMRGTELAVPRTALPPLEDGEYYHADLIGLAAVSEAGDAIGTVVAVENFGAGDVVEIERTPIENQGIKRFMIPMRPAAVPRWDAATLTVADGWAD